MPLNAVQSDAPLDARSANGKIRVLLADDHQLIRQAIVNLLNCEADIEVVAEARNGAEAVELAGRHVPDVVLLDISMPQMDGLEASRRIKPQLPNVSVIGLSMHEEDEVNNALREAGIDQYFRKDGPIEDLCQLIRRVRPPMPQGD